MRYTRIYSKCSYVFKAQQRVRTIFTVIEMHQEMRYHGNTVRIALKKKNNIIIVLYYINKASKFQNSYFDEYNRTQILRF